MTENLKLDSCLYKPLKSASAVANAIHIGSTFHEENTRGAKRSLDGTDIRHQQKSTEHTGWPSRSGRYSRDDLGLNISRLEDELSLCRLDGHKEPLSHGPLCKCTHSARPGNQLQDVTSQHRSATDRISSVACRSDDYGEWNPVEPFPNVQFESSRVPFVRDVPVRYGMNFENDHLPRSSYDALLSAISVKVEMQSKVSYRRHHHHLLHQRP